MKARCLQTMSWILAAGVLSAGLRAQTATDGTITGSGTAGYIPKFTGNLTIGNSNIFWLANGAKIGIATTNPAYRLDVNGTIQGTTLRGGTLDTGFGANELYPMNQAVRSTDAVTFSTINTGHGANELFPMNQAVRTTDNVSFGSVTSQFGTLTFIDASQVSISTSNAFYELEVGGTVRADDYLYNSDARFKSEIAPLEGSLEKLRLLRGVSYRAFDARTSDPRFSQDRPGRRTSRQRPEDRVQVGLVAQEVEAVFPELVSTDDQGYKSVSYARLVAVLIEAVKEQQKQIEILQARVDGLR